MEIRRTAQFLKFALGTRSPANPNYFRSSLYSDPNQTMLKLPNDVKAPYYDPITKTLIKPLPEKRLELFEDENPK